MKNFKFADRLLRRGSAPGLFHVRRVRDNERTNGEPTRIPLNLERWMGFEPRLAFVLI